MIKLSFSANLLGIKYFLLKLHKPFEADICFVDSKKKCNELIALWDTISKDVNSIIEHPFGKVNYDLKVEIYPEYFLLGAINIEKGIIVLGQPSRSTFFYGGLLLHELIHFILKNRGLNAFIEETICFLFERMFILKYDGISIDNFEYDQQTDDFHKYSLIYSKDFFDDFMLFYKKRDISGLIDFLDKKIDSDKKNIEIKHGLITYLSKNE